MTRSRSHSAGASERATHTGRSGRRRSTSADRIGAVGIALFAEHGFERTSVDEIAETAGIARRTFFRYFPSKNAVPWGNFSGHLDRMRAGLDSLPDDIPLADGLRRILLDFNTFPEGEADTHRRRMELILEAPSLQAYSMLMYTDWRHAIAEYVARRTGMESSDHIPQSVAWQMLGVALSAYESWLHGGPRSSRTESDLHTLLDEGMRVLADGLGALQTVPAGGGDAASVNGGAGAAAPGSAYTLG